MRNIFGAQQLPVPATLYAILVRFSTNGGNMRYLILMFVVIASTMFAETNDLKRNSIEINPFAIATGNISINYQYLFTGRMGVDSEFGLNFQNINNYYLMLAFRNYLFEDNSSLFYELFGRYKNSNNKTLTLLSFNNNSSTSESVIYSMNHIDLGLCIGYRWIIFKLLPITIKLGESYPIGQIIYNQVPTINSQESYNISIIAIEGLNANISIGIIF
jgi:hypothetical protein